MRSHEQILTMKLPLQGSIADSLRRYLPFPNVWLGVTAENQAIVDRRIPLLLQVPAAVSFLSCEPLLSSIVLPKEFLQGCSRERWVICGGESGSKSRACNTEWLVSIVEQCQNAEIPVFVKQLGSNACLGGTRVSREFVRDRKGANIN